MRFFVLSLLLLSACGGALSEGKSDFIKGRYAEARDTFLAVEWESRSWSDARRAEYALYRGLTHGALGDVAAAGVWLREAKAIEDSSPGSLTTEDLSRLKVALKQLDATPSP